MNDILSKIFTVNLGVKKGETVIVFTDRVPLETKPSHLERKSSEELHGIARALAEQGEGLCKTVYIEYPTLGQHGVEPPAEIWEAAFGRAAIKALKDAHLFQKISEKKAGPDDIATAERIIKKTAVSPNAIIAIARYSTSHTRFRDFLTRCMGVRYASMPIFDAAMLTGAMTADWTAVKERTERLVKRMTGADTVYITSHNGTSISFSIKGRLTQPDTGIITEPGSFSNLPGGEAFLAPVEGTAQGMLIIEWAPTRRLARPIELTVKDGMVTAINGQEPFADELKKVIEKTPDAANIAELGIGTNEKASRPDNILETEKILGTVHIALGDNSSFGGKVSVPFHEDFIFFKPTMEIIKNGEKLDILIEGDPRW